MSMTSRRALMPGMAADFLGSAMVDLRTATQ
jgi:hypothetical protein